MNTFIPHDEWVKTLAKKPSSSSVLFIDEEERILIVKPSYRDHWQFPGGIIDKDESPRDAAIRECMEEISIAPKDPIFLGIVYMREHDTVQHRFFGGRIRAEDVTIDDDEIIEARFVTIEEAYEVVGIFTRSFLKETYDAARLGGVVYGEV